MNLSFARLIFSAFAVASAASLGGCASNEPAPPTPSAKTSGTQPRACQHAGKTYVAGDSFPSADGCNTCTCTEQGSVSCTERACACNPDKETNRRYKMRDPKQCKAALFSCEAGTKPFFNECGCGCE